MPNVDFSLEDVKTIVTASEQRVIKHMDARFAETHQATIDLVGTVLDQLDEQTEQSDRIEKELKTTSRLVRQHSVDIMQLRSAS